MFAKSASLFTSFGLDRPLTVLRNSGNIFMFAKSASSFTRFRHNRPLTDIEESDNIFKLTLSGDGDDAHFLTPALLESLHSNLDVVKSNATNGSVLIITAEGKHFCQGFKFRRAGAAHSKVNHKDEYGETFHPFRELVKDLMSLPMPTIAAINGYTRSAGLILALSHDYLTIKSGMDALCMSDLEAKMTLPDYFTAMIRSKVAPGALARLALSGLTFTAKDAEKMGLAVEPPQKKNEEPLDTAIQLAKELSTNGWDGEVYAEMRKALYPDLCNVLGLSSAPELPSRL